MKQTVKKQVLIYWRLQLIHLDELFITLIPSSAILAEPTAECVREKHQKL